MPIYKAYQTQLPTITPTAHTFTVIVYLPTSLPPDHDPTIIAHLTLAKDPSETWSAFQARAYTEIADTIANYEIAQNLHAHARTWLHTQEWTT